MENIISINTGDAIVDAVPHIGCMGDVGRCSSIKPEILRV